MGFTPTLLFPFRGLDPNASYQVEVKTVWQDGRASEKSAKLKFDMKALLPKEIQISELDPVRSTPGWRQLEVNRTIQGKGISLGAQTFEKGIGIPRNSEVEYELKGTYDKFSAIVGVDDGSSEQTTVEFVVIGDGKELWRSGVLKKSDRPKQVSVDIKGVRRLLLRINAGPTGGGGDQAEWADAKITKQ
jgi:alpha-galactosidase